MPRFLPVPLATPSIVMALSRAASRGSVRTRPPATIYAPRTGAPFLHSPRAAVHPRAAADHLLHPFPNPLHIPSCSSNNSFLPSPHAAPALHPPLRLPWERRPGAIRRPCCFARPLPPPPPGVGAVFNRDPPVRTPLGPHSRLRVMPPPPAQSGPGFSLLRGRAGWVLTRTPRTMAPLPAQRGRRLCWPAPRSAAAMHYP